MDQLNYKSSKEVALYEVKSVPRERKIFLGVGRSMFRSTREEAVMYLSNQDDGSR